MFLTTNNIDRIDKSLNYVMLRISGLYGDSIHSSSKFREVIKRYPEYHWIIMHTYHLEDRARDCYEDLFKYWTDNGRLKYWIYHNEGVCWNDNSKFISYAKRMGIKENRIIDLFVGNPQIKNTTPPHFGIDIPIKKDPNKAVIFRKSSFHNHYPGRNRPYEEWKIIEEKLLSLGYDVYLLGHNEDEMPVTEDVIDLRRKFKIREVLDFTKDASLCITTTTFLYVWTQFVCPTYVLSEEGDFHNLNTNWRLTNDMEVINVSNRGYLNNLLNKISTKKTKSVQTIVNIPTLQKLGVTESESGFKMY